MYAEQDRRDEAGMSGAALDPAHQANAGFVAEFGQPVLALLAPRPGERILDLGCGTVR